MATANAMFTITDVGDLNGRNLVLNSGGERSGTVPSSRDNVYVTSYSVSEFGNSFVHTQNQQLTISCEYEVTGNSLDTAYIYFQLNGTQTIPDNRRYVLDDPSGDFQVTFKVTSAQASSSSSYIRVRLFHASAGSVVSVKNVKLEIGDAATDWTPAPEDVSTALDDAKEAKELANTKNSVYYQATAPTGDLKEGDTWFDTGNDYKISRWNGSTWVVAELGDQAIGNLNASHINAGTLTAVDIEAGKAQDIAGTIKVYDEDDAVKVSLDKDGLVATKGKIGNWEVSSYSIQYQEDVASSEDTVIGGDENEELIGSGTPTLVGGETLKLKICTYDPDNPGLGPHIISSIVENGASPQNDNGKTMRISNGGLDCYYNRNNGVTGGSVSINPKLVSIINADYDEEQVLWTDSANLNPGSLTIFLSKKENGERTAMGRSYLTYRDLAFIGDTNNPQLASGIAHWSIISSERTVKDTLTVTVYHCGNLFWAHFGGTIPAGWTSSNTQNVFIPIITDDTNLTNSALVAPPVNLTKYIVPTDLTNMRISVTVRPDGQMGISRIAEPFKGNATTTIAGYMETCDIFWAHIG